MDERRLVGQVLLNCVKPTSESIFGDLIESDVQAATTFAKDSTESNHENEGTRSSLYHALQLSLTSCKLKQYSSNPRYNFRAEESKLNVAIQYNTFEWES